MHVWYLGLRRRYDFPFIFSILLSKNNVEMIGITVYPKIPINRRFILFSGNAINPSNASIPEKIISKRGAESSFIPFSESPEKIKARPKKTCQARISME